MQVDRSKQFSPYQTEDQREAHTARLAAIALLATALILSGIGVIMMGISRLPANLTLGLGILPYTFGVSLNFLAIGLVISATACAAICFYYHVKQLPSSSKSEV